MGGKWWLRRARRQLGQGRVAEGNRTYRTLSADVEWFAECGRRSWGAHGLYLTLMRLFADTGREWGQGEDGSSKSVFRADSRE